MLLLRYGIIASFMEGMAFEQSPNGKIRALYHAETGNGDIRILRAGRGKPTAGSEMRGYRYLIEFNQ